MWQVTTATEPNLAHNIPLSAKRSLFLHVVVVLRGSGGEWRVPLLLVGKMLSVFLVLVLFCFCFLCSLSSFVECYDMCCPGLTSILPCKI
jgi:hypothetical protein